MNKKLKVYFLACSLLILVMNSCKTGQLTDNRPFPAIPEKYNDTSDSVNTVTTDWKRYFRDSSLTALIETGLKNNPDLASSVQRTEFYKAFVRQRKGALFPSINASANYTGRKFGYYTMDDAGNRVTEIEPGVLIPTYLPDYYVGLQTSWEIDLWGKLRNKKKAAIARYLSSIEGKNLVVTSLIADIANSYYRLLALDQQLDIIRESIQIQEQAFELIKVQKEVGESNELELKQFEAQLLNSKAMEYETLQSITETENHINLHLNRYPQNVKRNKMVFNDSLSKEVKTGIPSDLLKNRPDIRKAEQDLMASHADLRSAKAAFFPSLNITGMLGFQGFKPGLLFITPQSLAYTAAGGLLTPLINRSAIKAEFRSAKASQLEALYNYQKTILNGYTEVYNELAGIKNLSKIYDFKSGQVTALSKALDASGVLFKSGRANYIEVLLTQQNFLNSKIELIQVKERQYNCLVNLYKALGGGWR